MSGRMGSQGLPQSETLVVLQGTLGMQFATMASRSALWVTTRANGEIQGIITFDGYGIFGGKIEPTPAKYAQ